MFWDNVEAILAKQNKLSHGWQKEIANVLGISENTFAMQKKRQVIPKVTDAQKIADFLNISLEILVFGESKSNRSTLSDLQQNKTLLEKVELVNQQVQELKQLAQNAAFPATPVGVSVHPTETTPTPTAKPSKQEKLKQVAEHLHMSTLTEMQNTAKTHDTHEASDTEKIALKLQSLARAEKANAPIVNDDWYLQENEILAIPDCDTIAAGEPMTPLPELGNTYLVPMSQMPQPFNPKEYGIFRIRGNSMIDMGIKHGERVLIKWTTAPEHNTVMLVYRENHDGCTLKLLKQTGTEWRMYWCNGTGEYRIMQHGDSVVGEYIKVVELWRRK